MCEKATSYILDKYLVAGNNYFDHGYICTYMFTSHTALRKTDLPGNTRKPYNVKPFPVNTCYYGYSCISFIYRTSI